MSFPEGIVPAPIKTVQDSLRIMEPFPLYQGSLTIESDEFTGVECAYEYGVDSFYPVYVRAGKRMLVDSRVRHRLPEEFKAAHDIMYLHDFDGAMSEYELIKYSALTLATLDRLELSGEHVLDLGSADGVLSILAARKGARKVTAVDRDPGMERILRSHMAENGMRYGAIDFHALDICDISALCAKLPLDDITVVVANLGPHYGEAHLAAIALLDHIPNARTFVGGGYTLDGKFSPADALHALGMRGYAKGFLPVVAQKERFGRSPRMAFIVER